MKNAIMVVLALVCGVALWVTASAGMKWVSSYQQAVMKNTASQNYVEQGKSALMSHNMKNAYTAFKNAVAADSTDQEAQFYYAVTRVAWLYQNPSLAAGSLTSVKQILQLCGLTFTTFGVYDTTQVGSDPETLPSTTPTTGAAFTFIKNGILPELTGAIANLANVTNTPTPFSSTISPSALGNLGSDITVDYGDVLVIKAGLQAAKGLIEILLAYNLNVNPYALQNLDDRTAFRTAVKQNTALLKPVSPSYLTDAKTDIENAIHTIQSAEQVIEERATPAGHLFVLDVPVTGGLAEFTSEDIDDMTPLLEDILSSLSEATVFRNITSGDAYGKRFYLGAFLNGSSPLDLRSLITDANGNFAQPDLTWGGVAPDGIYAFDGDFLLLPGWNLVSLPVAVPDSLTVADVCSSLGENNCKGVYGYNAADQQYQWYIPGGLNNNLTTFTKGQGYWINMEGYGFYPSLEGGSAPASVGLKQGWNLVGYGGASCVSTSSALATIGSALQVSWAYSPLDGWMVYDPNDPAGSTLTAFCPNVPGYDYWIGYWIKVSQPKTWTVPAK